MNKPSPNLPDPVLPEHQLICNAAPNVTLSSGLKSRVMVSCQHQIALARWKFRLSLGISILTACCILLLIVRPGPEHSPQDSLSTEAVEPSDTVDPELYPDSNRSRSLVDRKSREAELSPGEKKHQQTRPSREVEQIHLLIEELKQREKKLCGLLPMI